MLVLDTLTGSLAAALYESLGRRTAATIPGSTLTTASVPEAATQYHNDLR